MNLYCTADRIAVGTGGGIVTTYEATALAAMGPAVIVGYDILQMPNDASPFLADAYAYKKLLEIQSSNAIERFEIAHFYSGSFPATVDLLLHQGTKVAYTCAAHDPDISRQEFARLGIQYNFKHLIDKKLNELYLRCYRNANIIICPSTNSMRVMRERFGCTNRIEVIPHGCVLPDNIAPLPERFTVGYLGQVGPDKGLTFSCSAWALAQLHGSTFKIATNTPYAVTVSQAVMADLKRHDCPIEIGDRVLNVSDFFNTISVYVSSSCTEGFGIPVLEAMAHGRPVICSSGTGAVDLVKHGVNGFIVPIRDPYAIADCMKEFKDNPELIIKMGQEARKTAAQYTWNDIMRRYNDTLRTL